MKAPTLAIILYKNSIYVSWGDNSLSKDFIQRNHAKLLPGHIGNASIREAGTGESLGIAGQLFFPSWWATDQWENPTSRRGRASAFLKMTPSVFLWPPHTCVYTPLHIHLHIHISMALKFRWAYHFAIFIQMPHICPSKVMLCMTPQKMLEALHSYFSWSFLWISSLGWL